MDYGKPTNLETVLAALMARVVTRTGIAAQYVHATLARDWFEPGGLADKYVLVTDFAGAFDPGFFDGGGNDALKWDATCKVALLARLDVDVMGSDLQRLTNASFGLLPEWTQLVGALSGWTAGDGGTPEQSLLCQPARCLAFSVQPRTFSRSSGWVEIATTVHIPYLHSVPA